MNKGLVRRDLLVVVSILNWRFSVGYIREIYNLMLDEKFIEYYDEIYVDGSDFTPLANLMVSGVNGIMIFLNAVFAALISTIFILVFAILLRVTTIRKEDIVAKSEVIFTRRFIIVSSVLAFIVGILSTNIKLIDYIIGMSWQQPLFMMLIYYLPLRNRYNLSRESMKDESISI